MKFKFLEHTADVKFRAYGKTLEKAFENAALALKETVSGKLKIKNKIKKKFEVKGKDNCALLYNFLEEFLFLLDAEDFIVDKVKKITINKGKLQAEVVGDKSSDYKFSNDVKAVTYNQMKVGKEKGMFYVQVVLDV